jgi:serine/threonine protein kinase
MKVEALTVLGPDGAKVRLFEKRLSSRERSLPEAGRRLRGEADLLARLAGRVTPRLVAAGEDAGGPWLRTEDVGFPTLEEHQARAEAFGATPLERDGSWLDRAVRAAFAALSELHEARDERGPLEIVHADLSPANVAVDPRGARAVILDLELAAWRDGPRRDGAFRGTVGYCAPEIARGEDPTPASDVFALAATFLRLCLGAPPRDATSLAAGLAAAAELPLLEAPRVASLDLPARGGTYAALARCLAHDLGERPATARDALALLGGGRVC